MGMDADGDGNGDANKDGDGNVPPALPLPPGAPQGFAQHQLQPRLQSCQLLARPRPPGQEGQRAGAQHLPCQHPGWDPRRGFPHAPLFPLCPPGWGQQMEAAAWLPQPQCRWSGAGDEALPASSPPRQEHAWHRHGSFAGRRSLRCRAGNKDVTWPPRGVEDGEHTSRKPRAPNSPGHTSLMRTHSLPAVALPGGTEGTGKGLSRAAPSQGWRMHGGAQVPRERRC